MPMPTYGYNKIPMCVLLLLAIPVLLLAIPVVAWSSNFDNATCMYVLSC